MLFWRPPASEMPLPKNWRDWLISIAAFAVLMTLGWLVLP